MDQQISGNIRKLWKTRCFRFYAFERSNVALDRE